MVTPVNITHQFNGDISATDLVDAASLDTQLNNLASTVNSEIAERQRTIRDGSGLASQVVRFSSLHPEVTALLLSSLIPKQAAAVLGISNVASLSGLQVIDGYTLLANDRILLVGQTNTLNNGLWVASAGAWVRPSDSSANSEILVYSFVNILNGVIQAGSSWYLSATATVGLTAQTWVIYSGFGSVIPISRGGTNATTANQALLNLGVSSFAQTVVDDTTAADMRITLGGLAVSVDTINAMTALSNNDRVGTILVRGYNTKGDGGGGLFYWDAASSVTDDSGIHFDSDQGGVGRFIRIVPGDGYVNVKWFGATGDGSTDDRNAILFAATWMATNYANKGGCTLFFPAASVYYRMTNSIDFQSIFSLTTPATQRLCQVNIEGVGRASYIRYEGAGTSLFKFGSYTNNVGMTGSVRRMRIGTNATITHSVTAYTPNFSTLASALYGSSNTTTTCILADTVLTPFVVEQCEITGFNKAYHIRNGFAAIVRDCQIAACNIGVHSGELTTSFTFAGNVIEQCAVGWFIDSGCQMTTANGISVIEANDVDILFYANNHLHSISGIYSEASRRSIFFSSDVTTDEFTPRQITIANCVGVDAEANSGLLEVRFVNCAFSAGLILGVNAGQRLQHIVIEDCFKDNRTAPFDNSLITGSGIYTTYQDEVIVISTGPVTPLAVNRNPKVRPKSDMVTFKSFYASAADTLTKGFAVTVPNLKSSITVFIEGHKAYDIEGGGAIPNLVYFKYVSYIQRDTGATSTVTASTTQNVWESLATTLTPHTVTNPTITITGAVGATQTIQYDFVKGYTGTISAGHYYKVTISASVGTVAFA